jgi:hypothetical protein
MSSLEASEPVHVVLLARREQIAIPLPGGSDPGCLTILLVLRKKTPKTYPKSTTSANRP